VPTHPKGPNRFALRTKVLFSLLLFSSATLFAQEPNLSFSIINGDFTRCAEDSLVNIRIVPDPDKTFSTITLFWDGDNIDPVTITDPAELEQGFTYAFPDLFDNCNYSDACISRGIYGSCFLIEVIATYTDGTSENVSRRIGFQKPPAADFILPITTCTGLSLDLPNLTCPGNDTSMTYVWTFPDGSTSTDFEVSYEFTDTGTQTIQLAATNLCGTSITARTIEIVEAPNVIAVPDSNVFVGVNDNFQVCLEGQTCVRLNGSASTGIDSWRWRVNSSFGVRLDEPDALITRVCFTSPGERTFILQGTNSSCNEIREDTIQLNVLPADPLLLSPQPDACPELAYTPTPGVDPNATYFIDEVVVSSFPFTMTPRSEPYVIRAEKSTDCGDLVVRDTIFVDPPIQPTLVSPNAGESYCPDTTLVLLEVSDLGGRWSSSSGLVLQNGQAFFDLSSSAGVYPLRYTLGEGSCERILNFSLEIAASDLEIPPDFSICATGDPVALAPIPGDGTLSGDGVSDPDRTFSPAGLAPGSYPIFYTRNNTSTGCTESGSWLAEVIPEPTVEAGAPIELCNANQTVQLLDFTSGFVANPTDAVLTFSGLGITDPNTGAYRPGNLPVGTIDTVLITNTDPRTPGSCASTDTLLVTITPIIMPDAGADTTICGGDNTFFLGNPAGGSWSGPNATSDGTVNLAGLPPSTYTYTLTLGQGICQSSDEVVVTILPGDGVSVATDQLFVCDTAAVMQLPPATPLQGGDWSGDLPVSGSGIDVNGAPPGGYNFQYVVSNLPPGCNRADLRLEILPQPVTTLRGDSVSCNDGNCVTFTAGGTPADSYRWNSSDGFTGTGGLICYQFPAAGDYSVSLVGQRRHPITGDVLCSSPTVSSPIRILDPPLPATITIDQDTICSGEALRLSFSAPTSANLESLQYEWSFGDTAFLATGPTDILLPSPLQDTTISFSLNTLGTCGRAQQSFDVFVLANPRSNIGVVYPDNCSGSELILTNLATGTLDETTWFSSDGDRFTSFQPPILNPVTGDSARTILYSLVAGNRCRRDTFSVPITVEPTSIRALPALTDTTVCPGQPFIINNISTPGTRAEYIFSDGRRFEGDSIAVTFNEPGPFSFVLYAYGCGFDSSVWSGTVLPNPDLDFAAPDFICPNEELPYALNASVANTIIYFGDGDSTNQNIGTHLYAPTTDQFLIQYAATSAEGCRSEGQQLVEVLPQPVAAIGPLDSLCAGEAQLVESTGTGGQTCRWLFPDGSVADGCSINHAFSQRGLSAVQLIYTSSAGCADTATAPIFVRPTPEVTLDASFVDDNCGPTEVSFRYGGNLQDVSSFNLSLGDGSSPISSLDPTHLYDTSGQITATLRAGFDNVCFSEAEVSFYLRQYPQARALIEDERCEPDDRLSVIILTENPEDMISGSGPNGYFENGINRFDLMPPGNYVFEVVSPDGCDTLIDYSVTPTQPLELLTLQDAQIELGDSILLRTFVNSSNVTVSWTPGQTLSDSTILSPVARPLALTSYVITVADTVTNCVRRDTVVISPSQDADIFVPTGLSPNEDGVNDVFRIFPKPSVERVEVVRIWDRWGNLVFEREGTPTNPINQFTNLWDGTFNGRPVNSAVFVYQVIYHTVRNQRKVQRGDLTVIGRVGR
jgi:gliding motility-associated-like protein